MNLKQKYNRDDFIIFLKSVIPKYTRDIRRVDTTALKVTKEVFYLGKSDELDLEIFELTHSSSTDARVSLAKDGFKVMRNSAIYRALVIYKAERSDDWRLSLMTATPDVTEKGKVYQSFSNPRRFSYFLGPNAMVNTPYQFLIKQGMLKDFVDLQKRFSIEVVNKEFYKYIAEFFYRLTGYNCKREMKLPSVSDDDKKTYQEFSVRLIGRTIFCWFLKHKKSANGISLIPDSILSSKAVIENSGYYHSILEKLFFEVLNTPQEQRNKNILPDCEKIPFMNGGLFEPHNDFYDGKPLFNLVIPDDWFEQFFGILEQYNFTIDENSPVDADVSVDPEMLGRIFENLLAEVNPETGETARKATGSYYTPRMIVDYMIDQSLKQYLVTKTKIDEEKVTSLLSYEAPEVDVTLSDDERISIISALEDIKILDPACGSGAFPMGVLHKMISVLQKVDPYLKIWLKNHLGNIEPGLFKDRLLERIKNENWEYVRKLLIIQKSIYGVDIQTIAVEISKLRFFLSLIVDEQINDLKENRGVEALPNLEFKFVVANSLIELPPTINRQIGLGINEEIIRLKELRNQYLRSYGREKKEIEEDFLNTRGKLIDHNKNWGKDVLALQLVNWNPFSNEACDWFDPDWMFGISSQFDIVIANPPYGVKFTEQEKKLFLRTYFHQDYQLDSYLLFLEKAFVFLCNGGVLTFIIPNPWLTNLKTKKIRRYIFSNQTIQEINHYSRKVFDSIVDTEVVVILKRPPDSNSVLIRIISASLESTTNIVPQNRWRAMDGEPVNIFLNEKQEVLSRKIRGSYDQLGKICKIAAGVKPYELGRGSPPQTQEMVNERVYDATLQKDKTYRPILRGRDIEKYLIKWDGKRWIKYGENLAAPRRLVNFMAKRKIVIRQTGDSLVAALDTSQFICMNNMHTINLNDGKYDILFLLGLINSTLLTYYFQCLNPEKGEALAEVKKENVEKLPIVSVSIDRQAPIIQLVQKLLTAKKQGLNADSTVIEQQIDQLVYELYNLTLEEINIVKHSGIR